MQINIDELIRTSHLERRRLIYSEWLTESEDDKKLRDLAEQYHTQCDAYDRRACTGTSPQTGEPIPADTYQQMSINSNAHEVHKYVTRLGASMDFTEEQVVKAVQKYAKR